MITKLMWAVAYAPRSQMQHDHKVNNVNRPQCNTVTNGVLQTDKLSQGK